MLPLKFDGGGYRAGGKAMFDSEGNLWVGDNFTVGWQASDACGKATRPSSRRTAARFRRSPRGSLAAAWREEPSALRSTPTTTPGSPATGSKSITVFDKTGKPLTPPEGITFGGRLGLMQGVIVTPSGALVFFPKGDLTRPCGRI